MNKASRLRIAHREWETGGFPSPELLAYQDKILVSELHQSRTNGVAVKEHLEIIASRHPAKNGFITTHDYAIWPTLRHHITPEDRRKTELQRSQVALAQGIPLERVLYHPYGKEVRSFRMTGTFADNERVPMPGQKVWLRPGVSGVVSRVGMGTLSLFNYVDVRMDVSGKVMTFAAEYLFDHEPEVVVYQDEQDHKVEVWE